MSYVEHGRVNIMTWERIAASGTNTLVFIANVTTDRSRRLKCKGLYLAQIQRNAAKLIRQLFSVQIDYHLNHSAKAAHEFLKLKKVGYSSVAKSVTWQEPNRRYISALKYVNAERLTNKQQTEAAVKA